MLTSWRQLIECEMKEYNEKWSDIIHCTLTADELNETFSDAFGCVEGSAFTAWTEQRVYFPICYEGSEWCGSAPRHPCNEAMPHQGGC